MKEEKYQCEWCLDMVDVDDLFEINDCSCCPACFKKYAGETQYCHFCQRTLTAELVDGTNVFVHDDAVHDTDYDFGGIH